MMRIKRAATIAMAGALSGCVAYVPRPIDRADFPKAHDALVLAAAPDAVVDELALLRIGIVRSPAIRDAAAAWRIAVAAAKTARVRPLGTLTLTAEYSHQDNPDKPWLGNATAGMPLDIGARRGGRIDSADLAVLQARYDYIEALWTLRSAIHRAVLDLRMAEAELPFDVDAVALRQARAGRLADRVRAGEDARAVELLARTDLVAAERRLDDARGRRSQAVASLAKAVGLPTSALDTTHLAPLPVPIDPTAASVAAWRSEAVLARPDVLRAVADYDIAEAAVRIAVARQYPDIQIGPGYTYERGITKLPFNLTLGLPPADFNRSAIREVEARRAAAGSRLESTQAAILSSIDSTQAALATAATAERRAAGPDLDIARRTADAAGRALSLGAIDRTDEIAARAAFVDARIAALAAAQAHALARADLDDAARPPLDPGETRLFVDALQAMEKDS